jgi:hypothetical protein
MKSVTGIGTNIDTSVKLICLRQTEIAFNSSLLLYIKIGNNYGSRPQFSRTGL